MALENTFRGLKDLTDYALESVIQYDLNVKHETYYLVFGLKIR